MRNAASPRSLSIVAIVLAATAATTVACSTAEEDKKNTEWTCTRTDVVEGEVTRCVQGTATDTAPVDTPAPSTGGATGGGDSVGLRTYGTPPSGSGDSTAPPPDNSGAGADQSGAGAGSSYECGPGMTGPDCPGDTKAAPPPPTADNPAGPDECTFAPEELPYCKAPPAAQPPAQPAQPPDWKCTKDMKGDAKVCETTPACAMGTHPGACGCVEDGQPDDCLPPSEGGCWVTGGGFIVEPSVVPPQAADDGHDNYGGNAKQMKHGGVSGHWNHVDHGTMNHAKGRPEYLFCRHVDEPGPGQPGGKKGLTSNQVYFGGHAEWRVHDEGDWQSGYWFDVVAKDHGEPGSQPSPKNGGMVDTYHFTIRKMDDPQAKVSGPIVYEVKGGLVGGNIQIHPSNNGHPGIQSPLPQWVSLEP